MPDLQIDNKIVEILYQFVNGDPLTPEQSERLAAWSGHSSERRQFVQQLVEGDLKWKEVAERAAFQTDRNWERMAARMKVRTRLEDPASQSSGMIRKWYRGNAWLKYAAVFICLLGAGAWWLLFKNNLRETPASISALTPEIKPAENRVTLTLADGTIRTLDSTNVGLVTTQEGVSLTQKAGALIYHASPTLAAGQEISYNQVTTSRGGQYQVRLPDGSAVWLNAASSLRFPVLFSAAERVVRISGEAYFEITTQIDPATGKKVPFRVQIASGKAVEVLGTHFNIHAYADELLARTTLLEGSVRVVDGNSSAVLKPGQAADVPFTYKGSARPVAVIYDADLQKAVAWKNGIFDFNGARLEEVMQSLSRWYDIEIVYEKGIPDIQFFGKISKKMSLSNVLKSLEKAEVHFRVDGSRRVIVSP